MIMKNRISVSEVAELMNVSEQFIRIGLQKIICATFGSSGNGLFARFQELWMLLKSAWFWYISNKQVT